MKCASLLPNEWLECEDVNPRSWQSLEHAHGSAGCSSLTSSGADLPSKLFITSIYATRFDDQRFKSCSTAEASSMSIAATTTKW